MSKQEFASEVADILRQNNRRRMVAYSAMSSERFDLCAFQTGELYWTLRQTRSAILQATNSERVEHLLSLANSATIQLVESWLLDEVSAEASLRNFDTTFKELEESVAGFEPVTMMGRISPLTRGFIQSIYLLRLREARDVNNDLDSHDLSLANCFSHIRGDGGAFSAESITAMQALRGVLFAAALASGILMAVPAVYFKIFTYVPVAGFEFTALGTRYESSELKTSSEIRVSSQKYRAVERVVIGDDTTGSGTTLRALAYAMRRKYNVPVMESY